MRQKKTKEVVLPEPDQEPEPVLLEFPEATRHRRTHVNSYSIASFIISIFSWMFLIPEFMLGAAVGPQYSKFLLVSPAIAALCGMIAVYQIRRTSHEKGISLSLFGMLWGGVLLVYLFLR